MHAVHRSVRRRTAPGHEDPGERRRASSATSALGLACAVVLDLLDLFANVPALFLAINGAVKNGVVVVAAAGNDGKDAGSEKVVPCVWPDVVCVGGLDLISGNDLVAGDGDSGGVRLRRAALVVGAGHRSRQLRHPEAQRRSRRTAPARRPRSRAAWCRSSGRSRRISPGLQVRQLLADAVCKSGHTARHRRQQLHSLAWMRCVNANGYLDVLDALHRARAAAELLSLAGCSGGWDQLVAPNDNPALPCDIPGVPFTWAASGQLGQWSDDAHGEAARRSPPTDNPTASGTRCGSTRAPSRRTRRRRSTSSCKLRVPDPTLGALTMEVFAITSGGQGNNPPVLKQEQPVQPRRHVRPAAAPVSGTDT